MASVQEAIRKLTVQVKEEGVSETEQRMKKLTAAEQEEIKTQKQAAEVRRTTSKQIVDGYKEIERAQMQVLVIEKEAERSFFGTAMKVFDLAQNLKLLTGVAYAVVPAFRSLIAQFTALISGSSVVGAAMKALGLAGTAAGAALVSAFSTAFAIISRIALPIAIILNSFRAMSAITQLGEDKIKELTELSKQASSAGIGAEAFQRGALAAKEFGVEAKVAVDFMTKFNEASTPKGGEGVLEKRIAELVELGNFANNAGVIAFRNAITTEERFKAIVQLITEATNQGERLAALDIASKFAPPEMMQRLRENGEFFAEMQRKAEQISQTKLISQQDVNYANDLKKRLEEAENTLRTKWFPIQNDLTRLGLNYQENWIRIVEILAKGVGVLADMYNWATRLEQKFAQMGSSDFMKRFSAFLERRGLMGELPPELRLDQSRLNPQAFETGAAMLRSGRGTPLGGTEFQTAVRGDRSITTKPKETAAAAAAVTAREYTELELLRSRIRLLGDLASAEEEELLLTIKINEERAKGVRITTEEEKAIKMRVRAPQLSQMVAELQNANRQMDAFAASGLNNLANSLADIATGAKTAKEAFANLGQTVARALTEMLIRMTIVLPIARALQAAIGGGGFLSTSGLTSPGVGVASLHGGGVVGQQGGHQRYVHPAYFEMAPRLHGGLMGDEFPAILQRGERVIPRGGGGSDNAPQINIFPIAGTTFEKRERREGGKNIQDLIQKQVNEQLVTGRSDNAMGARFGARPQGIAR